MSSEANLNRPTSGRTSSGHENSGQENSEQEAATSTTRGLTRRTVLAGTASAAALMAAGVSHAKDSPNHDHSKHSPQQPAALLAASKCADESRLCLSHCLVTFQEGDTTLADCARRVSETLSLCEALSAQLAGNSKYVAGLAVVCREACTDCEKECRKHEKDHVECQRCADSCVDLIAEIDKL